MILESIILITASVLIFLGIFLAIIPMLPALTYMFVVALAYAFITSFEYITWGNMIVLLGIVIVSIVIDHTSGLLGAKYGGAHTKSLVWGILGSIIGTFVAPGLGTFAGLFVSIIGAELYYNKTHVQALRAAGGALVGTLTGVVVNIVLASLFFALFLIFVLV